MNKDDQAASGFSERALALLERMTLEEKIGQLNQAAGPDESQLDDVRAGAIGSFVMTRRPGGDTGEKTSVSLELLDQIQRIAVEKSRLGIPVLFGRDVIHGFRTVFPIPLGQAASWDPVLVGDCSRFAAEEARAHCVHWTFAPMLDVARDPRWGRIAEGFGEDPYLCSRLGAASIGGFRGAARRVACCAKHFAAYGAAEGGRDYNGADVSVRALREVYLPPFEAAVRAGADSFMSAFNDLNGLPAAANPKLLRGLLRDEWGFRGTVVSDWNALNELMSHGLAADPRAAARLAIEAGVDIDMIAGAFSSGLASLVGEGIVPEELVDQAVLRVLRLKEAAGLFDDPYRGQPPPRAADARALARRAVSGSIVLLKNERGLLPLTKEREVLAITGPLACAKEELLGTWAPDGRAEDVVSVRDAVRAALPPDATLIEGGPSSWISISQARQAGVVIAVLGEHPLRSGEAGSVSDVSLPPGQEELLESLKRSGAAIVTVIVSGRPLAVPRAAELSDALLYVFHPGVEGGTGIADVLFGDADPGGRLPVSLPRSTGQIPIYYNHRATGRPPLPALRDSSQYLDLDWRPLFPFGFGLSYTALRYSDPALSKRRYGMEDTIEASVTVENTASRPGSEVVQLYARDPIASRTRPVKELRGFEKVALEPGEKRRLTFRLSSRDLAFFTEDRWVTEPGRFEIGIGGSSDDCLWVEMELGDEGATN